jgi:molybdenum cofactor cytidylyltransferase
MTKVGAIVLAAGRSSRFRAGGGAEETKLVAALDGKPIVRQVVETALASRARPVVVVVGHARRAVEETLAGLPATIAFNPDYSSGIASSLRAGIKALPPDVHGVLALLGDMPNVEAGLIDSLIAAFEARPEALAAAPRQHGRRGNPVLLARSLFGRALRLSGDEGARGLVTALDASELIEIAVADSDVTFDVDTPSDLERARLARKIPSST